MQLGLVLRYGNAFGVESVPWEGGGGYPPSSDSLPNTPPQKGSIDKTPQATAGTAAVSRAMRCPLRRSSSQCSTGALPHSATPAAPVPNVALRLCLAPSNVSHRLGYQREGGGGATEGLVSTREGKGQGGSQGGGP